MKEATGELNMTVVTVIIIAALAGIGYLVVLPAISGGIRNSSCRSMFGDDKGAKAVSSGTGDAKKWYCCPSSAGGVYNAALCQELD